MPRKTTDHPALAAMIGVADALEPLTDDGRAQVLRWVYAEYGHVLAEGTDPWLGTRDGQHAGADT